MKFLKPALIILIVMALTYSVSARKVSFNRLINNQVLPITSKTLPINGDLLFAFTAIFSLGGYMVFKK